MCVVGIDGLLYGRDSQLFVNTSFLSMNQSFSLLGIIPKKSTFACRSRQKHGRGETDLVLRENKSRIQRIQQCVRFQCMTPHVLQDPDFRIGSWHLFRRSTDWQVQGVKVNAKGGKVGERAGARFLLRLPGSRDNRRTNRDIRTCFPSYMS